MNSHAHPTSATQRKDRLYSQLAVSLKLLKQNVTRTTDLFESLQGDLDAMRTFAGIHAAQFMTVAAGLNAEPEDEVQAISETEERSVS